MKPHIIIGTTSLLVMSILLASPVLATPPSVPSAIDQFVAKVFPKARHYHWVVNNTQKETDLEMILDINTFVTIEGDDDSAPMVENRFLLLVLNGKVMAAQKIPLGSEVDCGKDTHI